MDQQIANDVTEPKEPTANETDAVAQSTLRPWVKPVFDRMYLKDALGSKGGPVNIDGPTFIS